MGSITVDLKRDCTFVRLANLEDIKLCSASCEVYDAGLYQSPSFWALVILSCIFMICYNVSNSLSDAICFDVLGLYIQYFLPYMPYITERD